MKWKETKRGWTVKDVDFPTVVGRGKTQDEALEDLEDKLEDYVDDMTGTLEWPDDDSNR